MELGDDEMNKYEKLSKQFYMNMYTEYLAHEMYLYKKYQSKYNYSIEVIWNTCLNPWRITDEERKIIFENARAIFDEKYLRKHSNSSKKLV